MSPDFGQSIGGDFKPQMDANKRKCKFSFFINVHLWLKNKHTPKVALPKI